MTERRFGVVWTEVAARDLERLAAYLEEESPARVDGIIDRIVSRADSLTTQPGRGRTPPELRSTGDRTWRELIEAPWRIIYRVVGRRVEIHGVLDGRRSLEDVLLERMLRG